VPDNFRRAAEYVDRILKGSWTAANVLLFAARPTRIPLDDPAKLIDCYRQELTMTSVDEPLLENKMTQIEQARAWSPLADAFGTVFRTAVSSSKIFPAAERRA
jgi:hypothetical protein